MSLKQQLSKILLPLESIDSKKNDNQASYDHRQFKQAGVLLPLFFEDKTQQWQLILTKRADHLKHHPGQISFPGGRYETDDKNLHTTALRETHEEIGLTPDSVDLLGRLPLQNTTSQYQVTPFVGLVKPHQQANSSTRNNLTKSPYHFDFNENIEIDKNEVAEAFYVPLDFVCNPKNHKKIKQNFEGKDYHFYQIMYEDYNIWGATARIIVNFSRRIARLKTHEQI